MCRDCVLAAHTRRAKWDFAFHVRDSIISTRLIHDSIISFTLHLRLYTCISFSNCKLLCRSSKHLQNTVYNYGYSIFNYIIHKLFMIIQYAMATKVTYT